MPRDHKVLLSILMLALAFVFGCVTLIVLPALFDDEISTSPGLWWFWLGSLAICGLSIFVTYSLDRELRQDGE